jgi:hypothetical protein
MPEKSKAVRKKPALTAPPKRAPDPKKVGKPAATPTYYLTISPAACTITTSKPRGEQKSQSFSRFEDARLAAIDALLANIEAAERRLIAIKRATSAEQLPDEC